MSNKTTETLHDKRLRAITAAEAVAEFKAKDEEAMNACVEDLTKVAQLDAETAKKIAVAYRNQVAPELLRNSGVDEARIAKVVGTRTANFADVLEMKKKDDQEDKAPEDETLADEIDEHGHVPTPEEEELEGEKPEDHSPEVEEAIEAEGNDPLALPEENENDLSEDEDITVIQLEIPTEKLDAVQQAIQEAVQNALGETVDTPDDLPIDEANNPLGEDTNMKPEVLAARKQARAAILAKANVAREVVAEELPKPKDIGLGTDTSHGGKPYQHNESAQYKFEDDHEHMTLERSEGNSLKDQNVKFNKQMIPTNNPENLGFKESMEVGKKEGSPDGSLQYKVDFDQLNNIPSGMSRFEGAQEFAVPTQAPENVKRTRNTAIKTASLECQGCNNPDNSEVVEANCQDCNKRVAICLECEKDGYCPSCASISLTKKAGLAEDAGQMKTNMDNAESDLGEAKQTLTPESKKIVDNGDGGFERKPHKDDTTDRKAKELYENRVAYAYDLGYQLLMNGAFENSDAAREQIGLWLNSEVTPRYMETQAKLLMASAQTRLERVASQAQQAMSRQASSNVGLSITPALVTNERSAPQDLQEALKTLWSSEQYEN